MTAVPDSIIQQFRTVALERLARVENAWATVLNSLDDAAVALIHREIHTLKGESRLVGFEDGPGVPQA
jgi:two-component system chemotaxis sensor kinase CheA